ncbi:D-ribose pyranase [Sansalvadorimonas sp. 2012CJ34-2]|uniref:D-ribose pyranase n=1 Tax=Parendozoicomonas callyspongiae TaxID=2942213 RepID=A0ABT0PJF9_9GAMM|nr:D-ribose pyranase [Sansalvadorimonas sp. 2012CJ34-2]MCL6270877.1 D-ribose pyranase [Sansalvadorimonas sp. 2012CJ34-2]
MKKGRLLNPELSRVIAESGHGQTITLADAGLPIAPTTQQRIDLALTEGIPGFIDTLKTVLTEMKVEEAVIASALAQVSPDMHERLLEALAPYEIPVTEVSHESLKQLADESRAVVRTGEFTPYANVILKSGVVF